MILLDRPETLAQVDQAHTPLARVSLGDLILLDRLADVAFPLVSLGQLVAENEVVGIPFAAVLVNVQFLVDDGHSEPFVLLLVRLDSRLLGLLVGLDHLGAQGAELHVLDFLPHRGIVVRGLQLLLENLFGLYEALGVEIEISQFVVAGKVLRVAPDPLFEAVFVREFLLLVVAGFAGFFRVCFVLGVLGLMLQDRDRGNLPLGQLVVGPGEFDLVPEVDGLDPALALGAGPRPTADRPRHRAFLWETCRRRT